MAVPSWEIIIDAAKSFGVLKGVFVLFFFSAHIMIFYLYKAVIIGRQEEINRLAEDNHKYRDIYVELLNKYRDSLDAYKRLLDKNKEQGD